VQPSPALRARVLRAATGEAPVAAGPRAAPAEPRAEVRPLQRVPDVTPPERPERTTGSLWAWTALAAAACLALTLGLLWTWRTESRWRVELTAQLDASKHQVALLEQRVAEEQRWAAVMNSPAAQVATFSPTPDASGAGSSGVKARAVFDPTSRRAVVAFANVHTPSGRDYQLWAIRAGKPSSLGLVKPDASGNAVMRIEDAGDPATLGAFAVSLEPQGGAPSHDIPTGPVVLVGKLGT
jgi:anti-sigma-K factor RskA